MPDLETLDERLQAVERALTGTDRDLSELADVAALATRLDDLEARLDEIESQITDLSASTQAVRGYVGNVRAVNQDVEQRADAALAKVEQLEQRLDEPPSRTSETRRNVQADSVPEGSGQGQRDAQRANQSRTRDDAPRWTNGSGRDAGSVAEGAPQNDRTARRQATGRSGDVDTETDDDGGFLSGLTGSL